MIDDLTTLGTAEPYRMFTSRAEFRLSLRADNADMRLTAKGISAGCVGSAREKHFSEKRAALEIARAQFSAMLFTPPELMRLGLTINQDGVKRSAIDILAMADMSVNRLRTIVPDLPDTRPDVAEQLEIEARYTGYLTRQTADIKAFRKDEALHLPDSLNYSQVGGLSVEVCQKLSNARPATLGAAARIPGITPAALVALLRHVQKGKLANAS